MHIYPSCASSHLRSSGCGGVWQPRLAERGVSVGSSCRNDRSMGWTSAPRLGHMGRPSTSSSSSTRSIVTGAAADVVAANGSKRVVEHENAKANGNGSSHGQVNMGRSQLDGRLREHHHKKPQAGRVGEGDCAVELTDKEINRRRKISQANKGKVPWNKGKNMTEEMKAKISQRTYEAMQRPEVKARMKKANSQRAPHSEEVRKRIREVLKQRADAAKAVISEQTDRILAAMRDSEHEYERKISVDDDAKDVIGRLAWRLLHRDFELMYEKWDNNTDGFRTAVVLRFKELEDRKVKRRRAKTKKKNEDRERNQTIKAAEKARSKLAQAEEKLESVEHAIEKLQALKITLQDDPESLSRVLEKENQTTEILGRLREQVKLLHQAMGPYEQQYAQAATDGPAIVQNKSNSSVVYSSEHKRASSVPQATPPLTQVPWGRH
ncbi:hypothetical protein M9435_001097 [Picochlorum sp. BPE23]|nr:hypothetical protein M9435_001097 [Picochlorum sp. BPE23]